jgi:hypothetical protein
VAIFVLGLILLLVAVCGFLWLAVGDISRAVGGIVGVFALVLGLVMLIGSTAKEVPNRSIGIATSFGKVQRGFYLPGVHFWVAPWKRLNIISESVQTTTFEGKNCLDVRIGGQQTACLDVSIQWQVQDQAGSGLFSNYGAKGNLMGDIQNAVVVRELKQVVNQQLGDYNPIEDVSLNTTSGNSQFSKFGPLVLATMRHDIGGRVKVLNLYMPFAHYDRATQQRLNTIQAQYAETAIARQLAATNAAQSLANSKIQKSLTPEILQYQCLQLTANAVKDQSPLPAGWNCLGGSTSLALSSGK